MSCSTVAHGGAGLGGDRGASAVLPSAGARAIAAVSMPVARAADRPVRVALGVTVMAEDDLSREKVSYSYDDRHPWFRGTPGRVSDSAAVGTARYAGVVTLGAAY